MRHTAPGDVNIWNHETASHIPSLNIHHRRKEVLRINAENLVCRSLAGRCCCSSSSCLRFQWLMDRIAHPRTTFSREKWKEDFKKHKKTQKYMQQFPQSSKGKRSKKKTKSRRSASVDLSTDGDASMSLSHSKTQPHFSKGGNESSSDSPGPSRSRRGNNATSGRQTPTFPRSPTREALPPMRQLPDTGIEEILDHAEHHKSARPFDKPPALLVPSPMKKPTMTSSWSSGVLVSSPRA